MKWLIAAGIALFLIVFFWTFVHPRSDAWSRTTPQNYDVAAARDVQDEVAKRYRNCMLQVADQVRAGQYDAAEQTKQNCLVEKQKGEQILNTNPVTNPTSAPLLPQEPYHPKPKKVFNTSSFYTTLVGTWINSDTNTQSVTRLDIWPSDSGRVKVHAWGRCSPDDCDWQDTDDVAPVIAAGRQVLQAKWANNHMLLLHVEGDVIVCDLYLGQVTYRNTEQFRRSN